MVCLWTIPAVGCWTPSATIVNKSANKVQESWSNNRSVRLAFAKNVHIVWALQAWPVCTFHNHQSSNIIFTEKNTDGYCPEAVIFFHYNPSKVQWCKGTFHTKTHTDVLFLNTISKGFQASVEIIDIPKILVIWYIIGFLVFSSNWSSSSFC